MGRLSMGMSERSVRCSCLETDEGDCRLFWPNSTDPFVQARATSLNSAVPGAIFRAAKRSEVGTTATLQNSTAILELTAKIYVHLVYLRFSFVAHS